jgi:hypothetical protein
MEIEPTSEAWEARSRNLKAIDARKSFLSSRAVQLWKLREEAQPKSFGTVSLERIRSVIADEPRWIRQLERSFTTSKS